MGAIDKPRARMGRPPRFPDEGPRTGHSLRLKPSIDAALREAAERNTRSLAEEMEHRLNQSFEGQDEAWKVAQLAATLSAGRWHMERDAYVPGIVETARSLLAEARRQVAADPARLP